MWFWRRKRKSREAVGRFASIADTATGMVRALREEKEEEYAKMQGFVNLVVHARGTEAGERGLAILNMLIEKVSDDANRDGSDMQKAKRIVERVMKMLPPEERGRIVTARFFPGGSGGRGKNE